MNTQELLKICQTSSVIFLFLRMKREKEEQVWMSCFSSGVGNAGYSEDLFLISH